MRGTQVIGHHAPPLRSHSREHPFFFDGSLARDAEFQPAGPSEARPFLSTNVALAHLERKAVVATPVVQMTPLGEADSVILVGIQHAAIGLGFGALCMSGTIFSGELS